MLHSSHHSVPHFGEVLSSASYGAPARKSFRQSLYAGLIMAVVGVLTAPAVHATIVSNPGSIVDHGSYITDVANGLDWYKFSNAQNTVGLSYDAVAASPTFASWSVASVAEVQSLEFQFGWTADTPTAETFANFGLTDAMAGYLGYTYNFYSQSGNSLTNTRTIMAIASDAYYIGQNYDIQTQMVTLNETYTVTDLHNQNFFYGDVVDGNKRLQVASETEQSTGTWLVRAHQPDGGGGAVPDVPTVPDASPTLGLCFLSFIGLISCGSMRRRVVSV